MRDMVEKKTRQITAQTRKSQKTKYPKRMGIDDTNT